MLRIGLLGAGRIGLTHAVALASIKNAELVAVYDPITQAAEKIATDYGVAIVDVDKIMADSTIDAVLICSPTNLHADQVEQAARAGKAIFCEKPIDLNRDRVHSCLQVVKETGVIFMVGFNRRFDASFANVSKQIKAGVVGTAELVQITSRDPAPPPIEYIKKSGGIFRDMMIHDFDLVRFLLGEECVEVTATGSVLIDSAIGIAGDFDSASATLKTATGKIAVITNSRRSSYGYDQRIEVHGSKGMIYADNMRSTSVCIANETGYKIDPLLNFFMERYAQAYRQELVSFVDMVVNNSPVSPTGMDGLRALELADAALLSAQKQQTISLA